jgi:glycosyltransferase involved in cell wall biosynthesis
MRVLLDLSPLKTGGGVQIALNFLDAVREHPDGVEWLFLLPDVGPLSKLSVTPLVAHSPSAPLSRAHFEYRVLPKLLLANDIDIIFTHFGPGLPHPTSVKSVVGVAYPIICYPDSPFWRYLPALRRLRQIAINKGRLARLRSADHLIVETPIMKERLSRYAGIAAERMTVAAPYPSQYVSASDVYARDENRPFNFLLLSGLSFHKNLWRLPRVARELLDLGVSRFTFTLSVSEKAWAGAGLSKDPDFLKTSEHFVFTGAVPPQEVGKLYAGADALVSLSDLESFSNNYMEAWQARVPLLVSDRDFARHICGASALYAEPHDPQAVAHQLIRLANDPALREQLVAAGVELLGMLPTPAEKLASYLRVLTAEAA